MLIDLKTALGRTLRALPFLCTGIAAVAAAGVVAATVGGSNAAQAEAGLPPANAAQPQGADTPKRNLAEARIAQLAKVDQNTTDLKLAVTV